MQVWAAQSARPLPIGLLGLVDARWWTNSPTFSGSTSRTSTTLKRYVQRWGIGLVLFGRVIPGIRTLVSIPAGLARVPFLAFFAATFAGAYLWCTLLIGAGYLLGHEWMLISEYVKAYFPYLLAGGLSAIALYVLYSYRAFLQNWPGHGCVRRNESCLDSLIMSRYSR